MTKILGGEAKEGDPVYCALINGCGGFGPKHPVPIYKGTLKKSTYPKEEKSDYVEIFITSTTMINSTILILDSNKEVAVFSDKGKAELLMSIREDLMREVNRKAEKLSVLHKMATDYQNEIDRLSLGRIIPKEKCD